MNPVRSGRKQRQRGFGCGRGCPAVNGRRSVSHDRALQSTRTSNPDRTPGSTLRVELPDQHPGSTPDGRTPDGSVPKVSYQVIARKWRPQTFDEVTGQSHVTTPLRNAITNRANPPRGPPHGAPRRRQDDPGPHPRPLSQLREAAPRTRPAGPATACSRDHPRDVSTDVQEVDAASRTSVDDVRGLIESIRYAPSARQAPHLRGRRGAHAVDRGLQRAAQDAGRAAAVAACSSSRRRTPRRSRSRSSRAASATTCAAFPPSRSQRACEPSPMPRASRSPTAPCWPWPERARARCATPRPSSTR